MFCLHKNMCYVASNKTYSKVGVSSVMNITLIPQPKQWLRFKRYSPQHNKIFFEYILSIIHFPHYWDNFFFDTSGSFHLALMFRLFKSTLWTNGCMSLYLFLYKTINIKHGKSLLDLPHHTNKPITFCVSNFMFKFSYIRC